MNYIPPYSQIKQKFRLVGANGKLRVDMRHDDFVQFIRTLLKNVQVDEQWYLTKNPDVAEAIKAGTYESAQHHFAEEGYFEGRTPFEFSVDENWYTQTYADVAAGIKDGSLNSAREHFLSHGYVEGRLPAAGY